MHSVAPRRWSDASRISAPAMITSARFGWSPGSFRRSSSGRADELLDQRHQLRAAQRLPVHALRIVGLHRVQDGKERGDRPRHADHRAVLRRGRELGELLGHELEQGGQLTRRRGIAVKEALGEAHAAHVETPGVGHLAVRRAVDVLGGAAADVQHAQRRTSPEVQVRGQVGQPGLRGAADDLHRHPGPLLGRREEVRSVAGVPCRAGRGDRDGFGAQRRGPRRRRTPAR